MIVYGMRASKIGNFRIKGTDCQTCKFPSQQEVTVFGRYIHIFWIPIIPAGRKAVAECTSCKITIPKSDFPAPLSQQYEEQKKKVKRPIRHWLVLILLGIFAGTSTFAGLTHEENYRDESLKTDFYRLKANPTMDEDSISARTKIYIDEYANNNVDLSRITYYTNVKDDKILALLQIPDLKKIEKPERKEILDLVVASLSYESSLVGKTVYIGIKGHINMMMIKTPKGIENSRLINYDAIYDFYGMKIR